MTITLYKNNEEKVKINKTPTKITDLSNCKLLNDTSIINPSFEFSTQGLDDLVDCNYIYVPDFNRYYFVNDVTSLSNNRTRIDCHVDVLKSFEDAIKEQNVVISRNEEKYDAYLPDNEILARQHGVVFTKTFPNALNNDTFCLIVAGS